MTIGGSVLEGGRRRARYWLALCLYFHHLVFGLEFIVHGGEQRASEMEAEEAPTSRSRFTALTQDTRVDKLQLLLLHAYAPLFLYMIHTDHRILRQAVVSASLAFRSERRLVLQAHR